MAREALNVSKSFSELSFITWRIPFKAASIAGGEGGAVPEFYIEVKGGSRCGFAVSKKDVVKIRGAAWSINLHQHRMRGHIYRERYIVPETISRPITGHFHPTGKIAFLNRCRRLRVAVCLAIEVACDGIVNSAAGTDYLFA